MISIKEKIKQLSVEQVELRNQRKTVRLQGERKIDPEQAVYKHADNRLELRKLYIAYGLIKGRTIEEIEPTTKSPIYLPHLYKNAIDKLVVEYSQPAVS